MFNTRGRGWGRGSGRGTGGAGGGELTREVVAADGCGGVRGGEALGGARGVA